MKRTTIESSESMLKEISLNVLTINRTELTGQSGHTPTENYLARTMDNFYRSGVFDCVSHVNVFDSGSQDFSFMDSIRKYPVNIYKTENRLTIQDNYTRALEHGASEGKLVFTFEDDIVLVPDFMSKALRIINKTQNHKVWTFYCPFNGEIKEAFQCGKEWIDIPAGHHYGNLAMAYRRQEALSLAAYVKTQDTNDVDLQVGRWLRLEHPTKGSICASVPSFVQHIGVESSMGERGLRKCTTYKLNDFKGYKEI